MLFECIYIRDLAGRDPAVRVRHGVDAAIVNQTQEVVREVENKKHVCAAWRMCIRIVPFARSA